MNKKLAMIIILIMLIIACVVPIFIFIILNKGKGKDKSLEVEFTYFSGSSYLSDTPIENFYYEIIAQDGTTLLDSGYTDNNGKCYYDMRGLEWVYVSITINGIMPPATLYNVSDYKLFSFNAPQYTGIVYWSDGEPLESGIEFDLLIYNGVTWDVLTTITTGAGGSYSLFVPINGEWCIDPANITVITDQFSYLGLTENFDLFLESTKFVISTNSSPKPLLNEYLGQYSHIF